MNKYKIHVSGTHCASCKILIEDIAGEVSEITEANVDLKNKTVDVVVPEGVSQESIVALLNEKIRPHKYHFSLDKITEKQSFDLWQALPIGVLLLALFFYIQKSGILNIGIGGEITPVSALLVGLIASVSSCLAVVGGLVLSISAKVSEDNKSDTKNFILFHSSRLVSFAILGGFLGVLGGVIGVNLTLSAILGIIASLVMLFLGLDLMGIKLGGKFVLPATAFNFFKKIEHKTFTPILLGFATFFLPCGFTQSMQVMALSSGSFVSGGIIMLSFALGTLPVLAMLSFGSASFASSRYAPLFFKVAGVVVLGFGIFSLLSGMVGLGIIKPIFNI